MQMSEKAQARFRVKKREKSASLSLSHLVPRHEHVLLGGLEGALPELDADGAAAVDHEVEPAVALRHRVTLAVEVVVRDAHADEAAPGLGHHAAPDHGRPAAKCEVELRTNSRWIQK